MRTRSGEVVTLLQDMIGNREKRRSILAQPPCAPEGAPGQLPGPPMPATAEDLCRPGECRPSDHSHCSAWRSDPRILRLNGCPITEHDRCSRTCSMSSSTNVPCFCRETLPERRVEWAGAWARGQTGNTNITDQTPAIFWCRRCRHSISIQH